VWIGVELFANNGGKTFIRLPSWARHGIRVCSPLLYLVDPVVDLCSRERFCAGVIPEFEQDLNRLHALVGQEFDDVPLFQFHRFGTFQR
jgi:hypothetical protein